MSILKNPSLKCLPLLAALGVCAGAFAQTPRVQFPTAQPGSGAYGAPTYNAPTWPTTPAPTLPGYGYDPYSNSALGPPPVDVPYSSPPVGGSPYGSPPAGVSPYNPPATYGAPATSGANGAPFGFEQGTYTYQNPDGTTAKLQRFLQQLSVEQTFLYGKHSTSDLEINRTELAATFGMPIFYNPDTPLLITPGFAFNWWEGPISDGPGSADLPPRVYDAYLDVGWFPRFTDWFHGDLGVRTGVWTDFNVVNSESVRYMGRGLGVLSFSPRLDVLAGVWYIDRNRIKLLPAGGIHWRPNAEWDAYIVFPNPKIRKRFVNIGTSQWWWYVSGEYGGGNWTIERADGAADSVDYNDIRVILGLEWETQTQARGHVEVGYAWNRELVYRHNPPSVANLDETVMVRLGVDF